MSFDDLKAALRGEVITAADGGYADHRAKMIWNGRKPDAQPVAIVRARTVADVQTTIAFAARRGISVSPRGTGHNFSGIALQDGIVLDLSALNQIEIDSGAGIAVVGPTACNDVLAERLAEAGFAFPVGHCASVSLSGYLLGGGFGWNSGEWGMACHSVDSADVVLADGRLVSASAAENPELFWALRGGGPLFPGVVVRYRLRLQKLRRGMIMAIRSYPIERIDEVSRWMQGVMAVAPDGVEFTVILHSAPPPVADPSVKLVTAIPTVFAESDADAQEALEGIALWAPADPLNAVGPIPATYGSLYAGSDQANPVGARYLAEAVWSDEPRRLFRIMADAVARAPSAASYAVGSQLPARSFASRPLPDSAFSMAGSGFGALYGIWDDPAQDAANTAWLRAAADAMSPVTRGHYVGEADLARPERLAQCYAPEAWARLQTVRGCYDPTGLFRRASSTSAAPLAIAAE
ncbi:MAG: FAD-binding oxidoreductase [Rhodobacteraceae bacterium]|nr:FAD-binding oxidoreductase [Paracoccaceae bacterium]